MPEKFYITTPLYYVNGEPHLGSAYTTIFADVITRFHKKMGFDTRFLTGVDEHGQKILEASSKAGIDPQDFCNQMAQRYVETWKKLSIDYDVFFRTTDPAHVKFVQNILQKVYDNGDIYLSEYSGWYCTPDERFWTEKDIVEGNCPLCGRPVHTITEQNYFFRMSRYQQWLIDHIKNNPDCIKPVSRKNEVLGFLKKPLEDLCISRPRARLSWGVSIPFDDNYVTYVWFDALFNYLSSTRIHNNMSEDFWPADYHLLGKDILTTHCVYWPTFLKAAGFEPVKSVFAHGWWLADKGKMSKSQGTVVKPLDLIDKLGIDVDAFRYTLMREMVPEHDAKFSEDILIKRYNSDLANDLGNLYNRLWKMYVKYNWENYRSPEIDTFIETEIAQTIEQLRESVYQSIRDFHPHTAIEEILQFVRGLNKQIEQWKPWKLDWSVRNDVNTETATAMLTLIRDLYHSADLLEPVMPAKMAELKSWIETMHLPAGGAGLFPRIVKSILEEKEQITITPEKRKEEPEKISDISFEDFARLDLRVGKIISARKHENADKLLVLEVDLGDEKRQVVAGIAISYEPENLIGLNVAVVANLKPAKLRGEISAGMILAANQDGAFSILSPNDDLKPGVRIS